MRTFRTKDALASVLFAAGLIGIAFIGVAFGHALKLGDMAAMTEHPLFGPGVDCLSCGVIVSLLLIGLVTRQEKD